MPRVGIGVFWVGHFYPRSSPTGLMWSQDVHLAQYSGVKMVEGHESLAFGGLMVSYYGQVCVIPQSLDRSVRHTVWAV